MVSYANNSGSSTGSSGVIAVDPQIWTTTSVPTFQGSHEASTVVAGVVTAVNTTFSVLNTVSFVNGAAQFVESLSNFSERVQGALACLTVDLEVVASGLTVAAATFAATDSQLAATFKALESSLATFTNAVPAVAPSAISTSIANAKTWSYTSINLSQKATSSGGNSGFGHFFSHYIWHDGIYKAYSFSDHAVHSTHDWLQNNLPSGMNNTYVVDSLAAVAAVGIAAVAVVALA